MNLGVAISERDPLVLLCLQDSSQRMMMIICHVVSDSLPFLYFVIVIHCNLSLLSAIRYGILCPSNLCMTRNKRDTWMAKWKMCCKKRVQEIVQFLNMI